MDARNNASPPPGLRIFQFHGPPLPVPMYARRSSASYVMPFHTVPPPPYFHHSPLQVFAAISIAGLSKPFAGSPGTVQNCHSRLPVFASKQLSTPRVPLRSAPANPMSTFPSNTR